MIIEARVSTPNSGKFLKLVVWLREKNIYFHILELELHTW